MIRPLILALVLAAVSGLHRIGNSAPSFQAKRFVFANTQKHILIIAAAHPETDRS